MKLSLLLLLSINLMSCWADQFKKLNVNVELELKCFPDDDKDTTGVVWTKDGVSMSTTERVKVYRTGRLVINPTEEGDAAEYECLLANSESEKITVTYIDSLPPKFTQFVGDNITLPCKAHGGTPETKWNKDGELVRESNKFKIGTDQLTITNLTVVDQGDYICHILYGGVNKYTVQTELQVSNIPKSNGVAIGLGVTFGILLLVAAIVGGLYFKKVYSKRISHSYDEAKSNPTEEMETAVVSGN